MLVNIIFFLFYVLLSYFIGPVSNIFLYIFVVNRQVGNEKQNIPVATFVLFLAFSPYILSSFVFIQVDNSTLTWVEHVFYSFTEYNDLRGKWFNLANENATGFVLDPRTLHELHRFMLYSLISNAFLVLTAIIHSIFYDGIFNSLVSKQDNRGNILPGRGIVLLIFPIVIFTIASLQPISVGDHYNRKSAAFWACFPSFSYIVTIIVAALDRKRRIANQYRKGEIQ
ncbi:hypothetical protein [Aureimonas pseudogalii]|uniref:Uncharacterized protein n=1 Tax=Aureimonas pseudogalii TaxID=1744844 RepID=A0A7W6H955_9HYPH|nr:hypothetical protein [Aureimonas pseudogalii]MBB4000891.1 hypothetical protein [Aureimonas pseudogalii]